METLILNCYSNLHVLLIDSFIPDFEKIFNFNEKTIITHEFKSEIISLFNIIYPTEEYIKNIKQNKNFELLFFDGNNYEKIGFCKEALCKFEPKNNMTELLSHTKICLITIDNKICDDSIIYFGSHNLSKSAWGTYCKGMSKHLVTNFEAGLLFKPEKDSKTLKELILKSVPFNLTAKKYSESDKPFSNI